MFQDVYYFVLEYDKYQRTINILKRDEMPLKNILKVEIFYVWRIDFIGHFPSFLGNKFILVVDYDLKWVEICAIPINDARVVLKFLKKNIFTRFGIPQIIISTGGSHLCNK